MEARMRTWTRNAVNDPFYFGSVELAQQIEQVTAQTVILAFNEFCAPNLEEAFAQAIRGNPDQIVVITPIQVS